MGFVPPIDRHPCPVSSAITSQMFPPCSHLLVYGHQDYSLILETDSNCLVVIPLDILTIRVNSLVLKL